MSAEIWKQIPGYEGMYEVSDQGRIRSLDRVIVTRAGVHRRVPGRLLKPKRGWYWQLELSAEPRPVRTARVHHLVLEAFVGPRPEGMVARHLDDNRDNNTLANLAYGTPSDNMQDALRNGVNPYANKTHCPKGHPYAGENLYIAKDGQRKCRECHRSRSAERYARRRAAEAEGGNR